MLTAALRAPKDQQLTISHSNEPRISCYIPTGSSPQGNLYRRVRPSSTARPNGFGTNEMSEKAGGIEEARALCDCV